jgi:hypothetical protein
MTDSIVSPGKIRKFTVALARAGSTFSFVPARKIVGAVVVRIIGAAKDLKGARALAFAPFRFKFGAKGTLAGTAPKIAKLKQPAILSISPGGQSIMLQFLNPKGKQGLDTVFGSDVLVRPGSEAYFLKDPGKRRFHGEWFSSDSVEIGVGSLSLTVDGKSNKKGFFEVKRAKGLLMRAGADGVFIGHGKSGKRLK